MFAIRENHDEGGYWNGERFAMATTHLMTWPTREQAHAYMVERIHDLVAVTGTVRVVELD